MAGNPCLLSLAEAADAIRSGVLTAESLATSYLERIGRGEAQVRAWTWLDKQRLLEQARGADRRASIERSRRALAAVPIGIKDIIDTAGIPTEMGSPVFRDNIPSQSATCVRLLEEAGAIVQGKTATTEFASRRPGPTTNPWNARRTPGGSSSGSAAAVAAGFTAAAIGSQTLGSTIRPAAYCGVVGFKPTFGLISRHGVNPLSPTLDHVGLLTRTIEDSALLLSCLAAFDSADAGSLPDANDIELSATVRLPDNPPRLAAVRTPYWSHAEPYQQRHFDAVCARLRERGANVEAVQLPSPFEEANEVGSIIQAVEAAQLYGELRQRHAALVSPEFSALCDRGEGISKDLYQAALATRATLRIRLESLFRDTDAILTLSATGEAPPFLESTGEPTFCSTWSVCGVPALAFPTALGPSGLPLGVQLVGRDRGDQALLNVAAWCHEQLPKIVPPALDAPALPRPRGRNS